MRELQALLQAASVLALVGGCQSPPGDEDFHVDRPLPYRIFVYVDHREEMAEPAPPETAPAETANGDGMGETDSTGILKVDPRRIERDIRSTAAEYKLCTQILLPEAEDQDMKAALAAARRDGADLFLHVESFEPPRYSFSHGNAWFLPNTVLWFILGFPSFWVRDSVYEIEWRGRFNLRSVPEMVTGMELAPLAHKDFELKEPFDLNLSERGFDSKAWYTPPAFYEGPKTNQTLTPRAEALLARKLLDFLTDENTSFSADGEVNIEIGAPENLSPVRVGETRIKVSISSQTPLRLVRFEVDGVLRKEQSSVSMSPEERHAYPWEEDLEKVLENQLPAPRTPSSQIPWSATKTIMFTTEHDESSHRLRVLALTS